MSYTFYFSKYTYTINLLKIFNIKKEKATSDRELKDLQQKYCKTHSCFYKRQSVPCYSVQKYEKEYTTDSKSISQ